MSSGEPSRRLQSAKGAVGQRKLSRDTVKSNIRNQFIERLKVSRSKNVERIRAALSDDREYASLDEIRKTLLANKEAAELANSEEVTTVMKQLNEEMKQLSPQTEAGSSRTHNESEDTTTAESHMNLCQIYQIEIFSILTSESPE